MGAGQDSLRSALTNSQTAEVIRSARSENLKLVIYPQINVVNLCPVIFLMLRAPSFQLKFLSLKLRY